MKLVRNQVINDLECPQVQTDGWWPSCLLLIRDIPYSKLDQKIKVTIMKFGRNLVFHD